MKYNLRLVLWVLLASFVISLGASFAAYAYRDAHPIPMGQSAVGISPSSSYITPYNVIEPGCCRIDAKTGEQVSFITIVYSAMLKNILILFVPLAIVAILAKQYRKK